MRQMVSFGLIRPVPQDDSTHLLSETEERAATPRLLVLVDGVFSVHALPERGGVLIGRAHDCTIRIEHPSISRTHAILRMGDDPTLEDLGSANGTRLRGLNLGARKQATLSAGDAFELGAVMAIFQRRSDGLPPPKPSSPNATTGPLLTDTAGPFREPLEDGGRIPIPLPPGRPPATSAMRGLDRLLQRIAPSNINVLILGETGVGKEVMAERLHRLSARAHRPKLGLNCAALTETLLESELFGHEKGSFTGAQQTKAGLLETAEGGTVFLDEIGELPMATQVKLLRVLEERLIWRVGALKPRPIDVRFVAATHRDLETAIAQGRFRQDLYFRLNGITLRIPPLRERVEEIEELAKGFIPNRAGGGPGISREAIAALERHPWPGNIRELRNVIERAALFADDGPIEPEHLQLGMPRASQSSFVEVDEATLAPPQADEVPGEREKILAALKQCAGNQSQAAKLLGISRGTLVSRLDAYGIARPRKGR